MKFYFFLFIFFSNIILPQSFEVKVKIKNNTTKELTTANKATLILLKNGMQPLQEIKNPSGTFSFKNIQAPSNFPLLIQIKYKDTNYNKLIPPVPSIRKQPQEVLVYDTTNSKTNLKIQSLMQITKKKKQIEILKVFLIKNETNPKKSFYNKRNPIEFFIDKKATEITTFIRQPNSNMDIPTVIKNSKNGKSFDRAILPGTTELQVSYKVPISENGKYTTIEDKLVLKSDRKRIIFFRPQKLNFDVKNIESKNITKVTENTPDNTQVYQMKYPEKLVVTYLIENTSVFFEESISNIRPQVTPREIKNGRFFDTTEKSILGIVAVLGLLFSLSFFFVYKN